VAGIEAATCIVIGMVVLVASASMVTIVSATTIVGGATPTAIAAAAAATAVTAATCGSSSPALETRVIGSWLVHKGEVVRPHINWWVWSTTFIGGFLVMYSLQFGKRSHLRHRHGLQSTTLTFYFYKNNY
jgi:hypothetical protein